jgi:hypothetical protein
VSDQQWILFRICGEIDASPILLSRAKFEAHCQLAFGGVGEQSYSRLDPTAAHRVPAKTHPDRHPNVGEQFIDEYCFTIPACPHFPYRSRNGMYEQNRLGSKLNREI